MKIFFDTAGFKVRTPRKLAANPNPKIRRPAFDAVAYAAALEVLG
jgi:hypothetical protein